MLLLTLSELDMGHTHMGLHDTVKEGKFTWINGSPLTFQDWNNGEPNNSGGREDCVHFYKNYNGVYYKWNDMPCTMVYGNICEKNA